MRYVPLHTHSQYSILDSTISVSQLVQRAKELELSALTLTDFCNFFGAVEFYQACVQEDIQPILGCEIMVAPKSRFDKKKEVNQRVGYPIILLVKDKEGYMNLCHLLSSASLEGFYYTPRIDKELLETHARGLICLSGPYYGPLGSLLMKEDVDEEALSKELTYYHELFGEDFYLELQRHKMTDARLRQTEVDQETHLIHKMQQAATDEERVCKRLIEINRDRSIPMVATTDIHYLRPEDYKAHEILLNVQSGEPCEIWDKDAMGNLTHKIKNPKRKTSYTYDAYFRSVEEMSCIFSDVPQAIEETARVADKCSFGFNFKTRFYPTFVPPELENKKFKKIERVQAAERYLMQLCADAIETRYTKKALERIHKKFPHKDPMQVVKDRLQTELDLICSKGMVDYLLIVYDFIAWAKNHGIAVGPGRGSGAGSIILYLIGVTNIEPLRFDLFFERFINPERVSYPDIDVDICMQRRSEVIDYTVTKYGKDRVAQIITFGTMKAKMAIRDVGRVLSVPIAKVNSIAQLVPDELGITLEQSLQVDPDLKRLYEEDEDTHRILDIGMKLEGSIRNTGIHAAGLIISGDPLTNNIPVCSAKDANIAVTQYAMKPVEKVGMLKMDFLGLKTLTCIQKTVDAVWQNSGTVIEWADLETDDQKAFDILNEGKTEGIFQLESPGMQELIKQLHIDRFEEIIAVTALYRPGPMEMIPSFIQRKHGKEAIEYDHEALRDILEETYGIMVYQEQVMHIAQRLAGYSLGEGDVLRRAMGKKDKQEMQKQRNKFLKGAEKNDIKKELAEQIFDKIEKFASYGFNKSHAAAYAYLSYVTAYLKANHSKEWMASLMTCDMHDLSKVSKHIRECTNLGICVLPPDVNESSDAFVASKTGLHFALTAIKGVGDAVVKVICKERQEKGAYTSLHNFLERVDLSQVGKKMIESLILAGCFDFTEWQREQLQVYLYEHFDSFTKKQKEKAKGVLDLFSTDDALSKEMLSPPEVQDKRTPLEILHKEKELLGFYVTGHPLDSYKDICKEWKLDTLHNWDAHKEGTVLGVSVVLDTVQTRIAQRSGRKYAMCIISDKTGRAEIPIWPELYEQKGHLLEDGKILYAILTIEQRMGEGVRLQCRALGDLANADSAEAKQFGALLEAEKKKRAQS